MVPRLPFPGVLLVLVTLVAASAAAQVQLGPDVRVDATGDGGDVPAGNATVVDVLVRNTGPVDGDVRLTAAAPDAWQVDADPSAFRLAAGTARTVSVRVQAPDAGSGALTGDVGVSAELTDDAGRSATGAAAFPVTRVDPFVPPPAGLDPLLVAGVALVAVGGGTAVGVGVTRRRRRRREEAAWRDRETGLTIAPAGDVTAGARGRDVSFRANVRNESARPRTALVRVTRVPDGWRAGVSRSEFPVAVGAVEPVTVLAVPGPDVADGDGGDVVLSVRTSEAREHEEHVTARVTAGRARAAPVTSAPAPWRGADGAVRPFLRP